MALFIVWQQPPTSWKVTRLAGRPTLNHQALQDTGRLVLGEWLETDYQSRAALRLGFAKTVEVGPDTKLRLIATSLGRYRLSLQAGTLSARLWAPPFSLFVDTPSATAIDLGCAFTLHVDRRGSGDLHVTSGWVESEWEGRQAIVPAGAIVLTRETFGPGTPFFGDASSRLRAALEQLDFVENGYTDTNALGIILAEARKRDVITLLSLLRRVPPGERGAVFDQAALLLTPPATLTRSDVIHGTNQQGLGEWWKKLGFGDAKSWVLHWQDLIGAWQSTKTEGQ